MEKGLFQLKLSCDWMENLLCLLKTCIVFEFDKLFGLISKGRGQFDESQVDSNLYYFR